jgi:hypothetical protein
VGGWVSASRSAPTCWLEVTALPSMTRQAAGEVDSAGKEPKQMSTGLARMSSMLSGKMTPLVEAIELHEEPWIPPLPGATIVICLDLKSPQGVNPSGLVVRQGESKAKNSKVTHEHTEHRGRRVYTGPGLRRVKPYDQLLV